MMGASCSICDSDKVVEIPRAENQRNCSTNLECQERVLLESRLRMNFAPKFIEETTVSQTTIESICSEIENAAIPQKNVPVKETEEPPGKTVHDAIQTRESPQKPSAKSLTPPSFPSLNDTNVQQHTEPGPSSGDLEITRKVGEILDEVISPEPTARAVASPKVGRQSRLMHADLNTVVSVDLGGKVKKTKKKKVKTTLIKVQPYQEGTEKPDSPPGKFHVCKHGIPLAGDIDDDEEGCMKCQRPDSRGGRELQEYLNTKKSERKLRKFWAKDITKKDRGTRRSSQDFVEKALREFEEFHEKHEPPT